MQKTWEKYPSDVLDYEFDWVRVVGGDPIDSVEIEAPAGITAASSEVGGDTITRWRVSGGTAGQIYEVAVVVTTEGGQIAKAVAVYRIRTPSA